MVRRFLPRSLEELIHWYERYISPLSLIAGFLMDNLILLRRIDLWTSNALLLFYVVLAAAGIILINGIEAGKLQRPWLLSIAQLIPVAVQFAFGGLFSAFVSLYSRSAAFYGTWAFIAILACLLIGNERFRKLYLNFSFQVAMYFGALYLFFIFFLPVIFHKIGDAMFIISGLVAVGCIALLLHTLSRVTPALERQERTRSARSVAIIYLVITILYFTNLIPPLPLALKEAGVYHHVSKSAEGKYILSGEPRSWIESFAPLPTTFHKKNGESVYVFTAVFAPSGLSTPITYEWQRYDTKTHDWITDSKFSFSINGGRDGGYRGYSLTSNPEAGSWRVNVLTPSGLVIGRVSFNVVDVSTAPELETTTQ